MARRIEVNKPRSASEDEAQRLLARILPASWIITTNIKEHMFPGPRKPELDSILVAPVGLFVLDFKNYRGVITPMMNQPWGGLEAMLENPLEQASDNVYPLKDLLERHDKRLKEIWIESLIVLTNEAVELDWHTSDVNADTKTRITLLGEVESKVRRIAATRRMALDSDLASKILEALKPVSVPSRLFAEGDWRDVGAIDKTGTPAPRSPEPAPLGEAQRLASLSLTNLMPSAESAAPGKQVPSQLDLIIQKMLRWEEQESFPSIYCVLEIVNC